MPKVQNPLLEQAKTEARFWAKVDKTSECWVWMGALNQKGYGIFAERRGGHLNVRAHRFAYELLIGPIPPDLQPDHLCRNRRCVKPWHMELVTPYENMMRGVGTAAMNKRKTVCPQGHSYDVRIHRSTGETDRLCGTCRLTRQRHLRMMRRTINE